MRGGSQNLIPEVKTSGLNSSLNPKLDMQILPTSAKPEFAERTNLFG